MRIETNLKAEHIELVKIFFEANEMPDVVVSTYAKRIGLLEHILILLDYEDSSDAAYKISFMSFRNSGLINMLEDFLIKCNVSPFDLNPSESNERVTDEDLDRHFMKIGLYQDRMI